MEDLDKKLDAQPTIAVTLKEALTEALTPTDEILMLHTVLQRVLYRINRLNFFGMTIYDATLTGALLLAVRDRMKHPGSNGNWHNSVAALQSRCETSTDWAPRDVDPPLSEDGRYHKSRWLGLATAECDRLFRWRSKAAAFLLGGAANEVQSTLTGFTRGYGNGRLTRKHSTFLPRCCLSWRWTPNLRHTFSALGSSQLARNHNFLMTERKRYFLRYNGGWCISRWRDLPAYRNYLAAAQRLGLSGGGDGLLGAAHQRRTTRSLDVGWRSFAMEQYPDDAWGPPLGYDQERLMGDRAGAAVVLSARISRRTGLFSNADK